MQQSSTHTRKNLVQTRLTRRVPLAKTGQKLTGNPHNHAMQEVERPRHGSHYAELRRTSWDRNECLKEGKSEPSTEGTEGAGSGTINDHSKAFSRS